MAHKLSPAELWRISWIRPELQIELAAKYKCPKCDGFIPNDLHVGQYPGAISRRDNKTEICSPCGNREAFDDFFGSNKGQPEVE